MCEIQRCLSGACGGAWDCTSEAVIEIRLRIEGGFGRSFRVQIEKRCPKCYLAWLANRRRKNRPITQAMEQEERWWAGQGGRVIRS